MIGLILFILAIVVFVGVAVYYRAAIGWFFSQHGITWQKIVAAILGAVIISGGVYFLQPSPPSPPIPEWWDGDWDHYKVLRIESDYIDEDLSNFPVLVNSTNTTLIGKCNGGDSVRFLSTDNSTEFMYEIEEWTSGGFTIWVNISETIQASTDYQFLMYYSNSGAADNQTPASVWDSDFAAVLHMNEASGNLLDKTSNGYQFIAEGSPTGYHATGKVGCGIDGDGSDDQFDNETMTMSSWHQGTVEFWYNPVIEFQSGRQDFLFTSLWSESGPEEIRLAFIYGTGGATSGPSLWWDDGGEAEGGTDYTHNYETVFKYYASTIIDDTSCYGYINTSRPIVDESVAFDFSGLDNNHCIGDRGDWYVANRHFAGIIDELRISKVARSWGWLNATFHSQNQSINFMIFGEEEGAAPENYVPYQDAESPTNSSTGIELEPYMYVTCYDSDGGDTLNATWWSNSTDGTTWVQFASNETSFSSGTEISQNNSNFSDPKTKYWWSVNLTDGEGGWCNDTYHFTTAGVPEVTLGAVSCIITFDAETTSSHYKIYYGENTPITTNDNATYQDPDECTYHDRISRKMIIQNLTESTYYYYRIRNTGMSEWYGTEGSFTTEPRFTTQWKDEFYDEYLMTDNTVDLEQDVGEKDEPMFNGGEEDWDANGYTIISVFNESGDWFFLGNSRPDILHTMYADSADGVTWEARETINLGFTPVTRFPTSYWNDSGTWHMIFSDKYGGATNTLTHATASTYNGTYNIVGDRPIIESTDYNNNEMLPEGVFKDILGANNWSAYGQQVYGDPNGRYPGVYLGFDWTDWIGFDAEIDMPRVDGWQVYVPPCRLDSCVYVAWNYQYNSTAGTITPYLSISRNGLNFTNFDDTTPLIPLGSDGEFDDGMIYPTLGPILTEDSYDYVYYAGCDDIHGGASKDWNVTRVVFRKDGFTYATPSSTTGYINTTVINSTFVADFTVNGNFTETNNLTIEVMNAESGDVYAGFSSDDFDVITVDSVCIEPTWGGYNLSYIPEGDFRLNFSFSGSAGKLYSYSMVSGTHSEFADSYTVGIKNSGEDYFIWLGDNSSAWNVSQQITGFDSATEFIYNWNSTTWDDDEGCWENYSGTGGGTNFTVNTFDVIRVILSDSGTQNIEMYVNADIDYSAQRSITLVNETYNLGGNYTGYINGSQTTLATIANTDIGLETGEYLAFWDNSTYVWKFWIKGAYEPTVNVAQFSVVFSRVEDTETWTMNGV